MKSMRLKSTRLHVIFLYARQKSFLSLHLISLRFLFFILYIHLWMSLIFWNKCWNGFTKTNAVAASLCPRRIYWMLLLLLSCDIERSGEDGEVETFFFFGGREKRKKKSWVQFWVLYHWMIEEKGPHMAQWESDSAVSTFIPAATSFNLPRTVLRKWRHRVERRIKKEIRGY